MRNGWQKFDEAVDRVNQEAQGSGNLHYANKYKYHIHIHIHTHAHIHIHMPSYPTAKTATFLLDLFLNILFAFRFIA